DLRVVRDFEVEDLRAGLDFDGDDLRVAFGLAALFVLRLAPERLSAMSTPERRASESPIAIACLAFLAPCSPSRIFSISRFTNSPACVLADLPARLSARARLMVSLSGISTPPSWNGSLTTGNSRAGSRQALAL